MLLSNSKPYGRNLSTNFLKYFNGEYLSLFILKPLVSVQMPPLIHFRVRASNLRLLYVLKTYGARKIFSFPFKCILAYAVFSALEARREILIFLWVNPYQRVKKSLYDPLKPQKKHPLLRIICPHKQESLSFSPLEFSLCISHVGKMLPSPLSGGQHLPHCDE